MGARHAASPRSRRRRPPKRHGSTRWCERSVGDAPSGPRPARPATTTAKARRTRKTRQGSFFFGEPTEYADILEAWRIRVTISTGSRRTDDDARYLLGRMQGRSRRRRPPRVAIIGAGFGGLAAAVALRRAGHRRPGDHRGRRRRRRHLAAQHLSGRRLRHPEPPVLVLVRAQPSWSRTYARQPEILAYLESVADDFDLRRHLRCSAPGCAPPAGTPTPAQWDLRVDRAGADRTLTRRRRGQRRRTVRLDEASRYRRA